jgi:DNA-binding NarL/FixJ family response regulator
MGGALDAANFRPCCCSQEHFTGRELDILSLIASGHTNNSIARTLQISAHTVARHVTSMLRRANAANRAALVTRAYSTGVLTMSGRGPEPTGRRCVPT